MNWLDYLLIFILLLNFYNGFKQGLLRQAVGVASLFLAIYFALLWSSDVKAILQEYLKLHEVISVFTPGGDISFWLTEVLVSIIAFSVLFVIIVLLLGLFTAKLKYFNRVPLVGPLNALLGSFVGAIKGVLIIFLIVALFSLIETEFWVGTLKASVVVSLARYYMPLLFGLIVDFITGRLGEII